MEGGHGNVQPYGKTLQDMGVDSAVVLCRYTRPCIRWTHWRSHREIFNKTL